MFHLAFEIKMPKKCKIPVIQEKDKRQKTRFDKNEVYGFTKLRLPDRAPIRRGVSYRFKAILFRTWSVPHYNFYTGFDAIIPTSLTWDNNQNIDSTCFKVRSFGALGDSKSPRGRKPDTINSGPAAPMILLIIGRWNRDEGQGGEERGATRKITRRNLARLTHN